MFANECLGGLQYEATTSAIVVAGAFLTFLLQYSSFRLYDARSRTVASSQSDMGHPESMNGDVSDKSSQTNVQVKEHVPRMDDPLSVLILEAGIIFHSASAFKPPILPCQVHCSQFKSSHRCHPRSSRRLLLQDPGRGNYIPPNVRRSRPRSPDLKPQYHPHVEEVAHGKCVRTHHAAGHGHWTGRAQLVQWKR